MAVVGTAYVVYRGLTNQLGSDLSKGIDKASKSSAVRDSSKSVGDDIGKAIGVKVGQTAPAAIEKGVKDSDVGVVVGNQVADGIGDGVTDGVRRSVGDPSVRRAAGELGDDLGNRIGVSAGRSTTLHMERHVDVDRLGNGLNRGLSRVGFDIGEAFGASILYRLSPRLNKGLGGIADGFTNATRGVKQFGGEFTRAFGANKMPILIGGAVAAIWQLVAAIGPGLGGAVISAVPIIVAGLAGLGAAAGGLIGAFLAGGPALTKFKDELGSLLREWKGVGQEIGRTIFPELSGFFQSLSATYIPLVRRALDDLIPVFGSVLDKFRKVFTNTEFQQMFLDVTAAGGRMTAAIGRGMADLIRALTQITQAAIPLVNRFGDWFEGAMKRFQVRIDELARNGKLQEYMQQAADAAKLLWDGIVALGKALGPIFDPKNANQGLQTLISLFNALGTGIQFAMSWAQLLWAGLTALPGITGPVIGAFKLLGEAVRFMTYSFQLLVTGINAFKEGGIREAVEAMKGFAIETYGSEEAIAAWNQSAGKVPGVAGAAKGPLAGLSDVFTDQADAVYVAKEAWDKYGTTFDTLQDKIDKFVTDQAKIEKALEEGEGATRDNLSTVRDLGLGIRDIANARLAEGQSVDKVVDKYATQRQELIKVAAELFGNKKKAKEYVDQLLKTPSKLRTELQVQYPKQVEIQVKMVGDTTIITRNGRNIRVPAFADGGVVHATSGGVPALLAEAGRDERVTPLDSRGMSASERYMLEEMRKLTSAVAGGRGGGVVVNNYYPEPERASDNLAMSLRLAQLT